MTPWIALWSWPVISIVFFRTWPIPVAAAATLIGGYLLLPEATSYDLPLLPALGKGTVPSICALVLVFIASSDASKSRDMLPGWFPRDRVSLMLLAFIIFGAFGTALSNMEPVSTTLKQLQGLRVYDGFSLALSASMALIPFFIARKTMASPEAQRSLLIVLIIAASAYTMLALWEVRMSPQLNKNVYGFFPHSWRQHIRDGGFRPLVFLGHGLKLGIFFALAAIAAAGLWRRSSGPIKSKLLAALALLTFTIFMSKVLGAFAITLLLLPLVLFAPRRIQVIVLMTISVLVLSFPILRNTQFVPTDWMVETAESISPERAQSLEFRFDNEDILLERAREKPIFGWGGFGRNRVFDETGEDISTTDGRWVILFGQGGWARYLGEMGLLCWSILAICLRRDKIDGITITLMFALAANLIDLIPNSGMSSLTWLLAGALIGRLEYSASPEQAAPDLQDPQQGGPRFTRQRAPIVREGRNFKPAGAFTSMGRANRGQAGSTHQRPSAPQQQKKQTHGR